MSAQIEAALRQVLVWYGLSTRYIPGKGRLVDWTLSLSHELAAGSHNVERRGLRWDLDIRCPIQRSLYYLGCWEAWETEFLEHAIQPGWCVVDVGANVGYYALLAGQKVQPSGMVYAFEPAQAVYQRLTRNIDLNSMTWVQPIKKALGDHDGHAFIRTAAPEWQGSQSLRFQDSDETETVEVSTLDRFAADHALSRLDLIKVDIEGYEPRFFEGACGSIRQYRPLLMFELNPVALQRFQCTSDDVLGRVDALGYEVYTLCRRRLEKLTSVPSAESGAFFNVVAVPRNGRRRTT
jgi:FkbM family methyltransferase